MFTYTCGYIINGYTMVMVLSSSVVFPHIKGSPVQTIAVLNKEGRDILSRSTETNFNPFKPAKLPAFWLFRLMAAPSGTVNSNFEIGAKH